MAAKTHQEEGHDYRYDPSYLDTSLDELEMLCQQHKEKVDAMQEANKNNLNDFGITFDHSYVNITWRKQDFVALEVHKGRKDYLFNYEKCLDYFEHAPEAIRKQGRTYLKAIRNLLDI